MACGSTAARINPARARTDPIARRLTEDFFRGCNDEDAELVAAVATAARDSDCGGEETVPDAAGKALPQCLHTIAASCMSSAQNGHFFKSFSPSKDRNIPCPLSRDVAGGSGTVRASARSGMLRRVSSFRKKNNRDRPTRFRDLGLSSIPHPLRTHEVVPLSHHAGQLPERLAHSSVDHTDRPFGRGDLRRNNDADVIEPLQIGFRGSSSLARIPRPLGRG